jgi:hypothetical protein
MTAKDVYVKMIQTYYMARSAYEAENGGYFNYKENVRHYFLKFIGMPNFNDVTANELIEVIAINNNYQFISNDYMVSLLAKSATRLTQSDKIDIAEEYEGCVYCYEPKLNKISCCGENHFAEIYLLENDDTVLASDYKRGQKNHV